MLQKIKSKLLALSAALLIVAPLAAPAVANAAVTGPVTGGVCQGASNLQVSDTTTTNCGVGDQTSTFNDILTKVINIFSVIVGVIAVIMIIVGGFRYITSGGKQESVTGAKNTILYAVIGLVVVALAQVIVRFVLDKATS